MKEPITQIIVLCSGFIIASVFIIYWRIKFGKLFSSISRTAYHLNKEKKVLQFTAFITILGISVYIGGQTMLSAIGGPLLLPVGILTGYNPNIVNNKWENRLHVAFVDIPFGMLLADFIRIAIRSYLNDTLYPFWYYISLVGLFLMFLAVMWILVKKYHIKNHTTIIEYGMILIVFAGYLYNCIL